MAISIPRHLLVRLQQGYFLAYQAEGCGKDLLMAKCSEIVAW